MLEVLRFLFADPEHYFGFTLWLLIASWAIGSWFTVRHD